MRKGAQGAFCRRLGRDNRGDMRIRRKTLVVLGVVAAVCVAVVVILLWRGLQGDVAQDALDIWDNTRRSGQKLADSLSGR